MLAVRLRNVVTRWLNLLVFLLCVSAFLLFPFLLQFFSFVPKKKSFIPGPEKEFVEQTICVAKLNLQTKSVNSIILQLI